MSIESKLLDYDKRTGDTEGFRQALVHLLTDLDRKESEREAKRGIPVNIHRLSHYLKAADDVMSDIRRGTDPAKAFSDALTPNRANLSIARKLGLKLDVNPARWTGGWVLKA